MKKRFLLFALSLPVLVVNVPYLVSAWKSSRLDHYDWIFYLLGVVLIVWTWKKHSPEKSDLHALFAAVPALSLVVFKFYHQINALSVAGGVVFIWSLTYLAGGWNFAFRLLPGFVICLLGTPSSSYRLAQILTLSTALAMGIKITLSLVCICFSCICSHSGKLPKPGTVLFISAQLVSILFLCHAKEIYFTGRSYIPEFPAVMGDFYGRSIEPDINTRQFFATSRIGQYRYITGNQEISVLAVKCGKDVHEIHPASHCLRTSRWIVTDERIHAVKPDFSVTEINACKGNDRALIWVWYSNDEFSTPGFLGFRRRFRPDGNYHTFQISVPVTVDIESSRKTLKKFLSVLQREKEK